MKSGSTMEFCATSTSQLEASAAAEELCASVGTFQPDLAVLFVTQEYGPDYESFIGRVREATNARNLIGTVCAGVIGPDREIEQGPGAVMWCGRLPGARVFPFVLDQNDFITLKTASAWQDRLGVKSDDIPTFLVLPDPFSIQFLAALKVIDEVYPGSTTVGGVLSGAESAGNNRLFLNDQVLRQGMIGLSLCGGFRVSAIVSQGCRPIGAPFVVTKAESNVILELGGKDAYSVLKSLHSESSEADRQLMQTGLHVGRAIDEHSDRLGPGDFIIRNVTQIVDGSGLAVTDFVRPGQTVQFHVRDAHSADSEMRTLLERHLAKAPDAPRGGLLFSCNGRGTRLFPKPNHDIGLINEMIPNCPTAGFFAAGEIGPIGGKTFVHGLTSSLVLFHDEGDPGAGGEASS